MQRALTRELTDLVQLLERVAELENAITFHEDTVEQLKAERLDLVRKLIPDEMVNAGVKVFETNDYKVVNKPVARGVLPSDEKEPLKRQRALQWIKDIGEGAIIRGTVHASFIPGEDALLRSITSTLKEHGVSHTYKLDVHHATLSRIALERLREGLPTPPTDIFTNYYVGHEAVITKPKERK